MSKAELEKEKVVYSILLDKVNWIPKHITGNKLLKYNVWMIY